MTEIGGDTAVHPVPVSAVLLSPDPAIPPVIAAIRGLRCVAVGSLDEAVAVVETRRHAALLLDLDAPGVRAEAAVGRLLAVAPDLAIVVLAHDDAELDGQRALAHGAQDVVGKDGLGPRLLRKSIHYALLRARQLGDRREREALMRRNDELVALERARDQFVNILSHELRTPVHAIVGYSELVHGGAYGQLPGSAREALAGVVRRGRELAELLENVLNLSRIEAGRIELQPERFDVDEVLSGTVETGRQLIRLRSSPITLALETFEAPAAVWGDPRLYVRIVSNLVNNAVRHTERGGVLVEVVQVGPRFETRVKDTGRGMSPEELDFIFDPFRQVDGERDRQNGGTGLGLTIARRLAGLMGGALRVRSEPGVGSTFTLELPVGAPGAE